MQMIRYTFRSQAVSKSPVGISSRKRNFEQARSMEEEKKNPARGGRIWQYASGASISRRPPPIPALLAEQDARQVDD